MIFISKYQYPLFANIEPNAINFRYKIFFHLTPEAIPVN